MSAPSIIIKNNSGLTPTPEDDWMINSMDSNGISSFHSFSLDYPKYAVCRKVKSAMKNPDNGFSFFSSPFLISPQSLICENNI